MKTTRPTRIAITSGAAVLCLGVAAPSVAYACTGDGTSSAARPDTAAVQQLSTPTLQQEQSWIDSFVAHRTAWLDHLSAVVSADPQLTADQQAQALTSIAKAEAALTDLQSVVDAATSTDQVHDIVKAALKALPMPWWPHPMARHHAFDHHAFDHHAFDHHAFDHHAREAMHRYAQSHRATPTDVKVRYAGAYPQLHNRADGRQWDNRGDHWNRDWSRRADWTGRWGAHHDHWGGHHDGGWGH